MSNSHVKVPNLTDGTLIDNELLTIDGLGVQRQRVQAYLTGYDDAGNAKGIPVTQEGHLEVAIHAPRLPFGAVHVESLTPVFQKDAVYGVDTGNIQTTTTGTGGATASSGMFVVSTGATALSQGVILSRKRLRYRPGQGVIARFTAKWSAPAQSAYQLAGVGHAEDGVYFGYGNTNDLTDTRFGILYVKGGVRETRTLTVSVGATSASNCTITLNSGAGVTVALSAASNVQRTVWEISQGTYPGWDAYPAGATVVFVRKSAGAASGTYSFSAGTTGASASFAQTKAGVASTDTFIPQSSWNGDKLDGTGSSGVTLAPTTGNVFQIDIQYLGFGSIVFKAEVVPPGGNNADFVILHTLKLPNSLTTPSFGNPSFPFTLAAYSAGSTTDVNVSCASFAGFIEGHKQLHGNRFSYFNALTTVGATNIQALFTVLNTRYFSGRSNQAVINLISMAGALKHTSPCVFYLIKNGALAGNPNFQAMATSSCSLWDTASTTVSYSTGDQLLWTGHLGDTGDIDHSFTESGLEEFTLQPGEWVTLGAKAVTGTPSWVTGSINTREDQ